MYSALSTPRELVNGFANGTLAWDSLSSRFAFYFVPVSRSTS